MYILSRERRGEKERECVCVYIHLIMFTEQSKLLYMYLKSCYFFLIDDQGHVHVMQ